MDEPSGLFQYGQGGKWNSSQDFSDIPRVVNGRVFKIVYRYTEGGQLTDTVRPTTM